VKKLPPYAKALLAARRRGDAFDYVVVGVGWLKPKEGAAPRVAVPPDARLADLDWGWATGLDVLLWPAQGAALLRVAAVAWCLRAGGVQTLWLAEADGNVRGCLFLAPELVGTWGFCTSEVACAAQAFSGLLEHLRGAQLVLGEGIYGSPALREARRRRIGELLGLPAGA
jgi:hypothetical protein